MDQWDIHKTGDSSPTLYSKKYRAYYHSLHGAIEESSHVFISAGLYYFQRQGYRKLNILEMGFGTGLNAFLTLISAAKYDIDIDYEAFETDPLGPHIYQELPYYQLVPGSTLLDYTQIHDSDWAVPIAISSNFNLLKRNEDILQAAIASSKFDIIYYDAFAPSCQEQLWDRQLHERLYDSLKPNGCLVTYCSQGAFRRTLQSIGYQIEKLNGPGKKREMLRAIKI